MMSRIFFLLTFFLLAVTLCRSDDKMAANDQLMNDVDEEDEVVLERVARSPDAKPDPMPRGGRGGRSSFRGRRSYRSRSSGYSAAVKTSGSTYMVFLGAGIVCLIGTLVLYGR